MERRDIVPEVYVPDGTPPDAALARTTHIGIAAHQDDLEIMAYHGILECFGSSANWFTGVVVTDGAASPRDDLYADYTDERMREVRIAEQKKAAAVGEYSAQVLLGYPSAVVKNPADLGVCDDLERVLVAARPEVVYMHNLADKHDTHVATALRTIQALRRLPAEIRPKSVYGCEVWRDLDWLNDEDKISFDVAAHENLAEALLGVFDSQISGGKRYDLAAIGRRRAHASFSDSHGTDVTTAVIFAMDLTPLVNDPSLDIRKYVDGCIQRFAKDAGERIGKLSDQ